jgi:hypothetical protein
MVGPGMTVNLHARKSLGRHVGYVDSSNLDAGVVRIYFEAGSIPTSLSAIGHELTHVLQHKRGDLSFEGDTILWKRRPYMTRAEYDALDYKGHGKLPWEKQAVIEGKARAQAFLKSAPTTLRGKDPALDYMFDNDLL